MPRPMDESLESLSIPGTEVLVDSSIREESVTDCILVPQPSDDVHDPLNWNAYWKFSTTAAATFVSFAQGFGPLAIAPTFKELAKEFHSDLPSVIQFTGVTILVLGFSNFIWIPLSSTFGRRPVLLASTLLSLASSIWKAEAKTYSSFMGACVLNGIGAGPGETLQPQIITDYIFLHDRGKYNTLYFASYFGSLALSPVIAGLLAEHGSWRNFWWLNVALLGMAFVVSLFAFPETRWHRPGPSATPTNRYNVEKSGQGGAKHGAVQATEVQTSDKISEEKANTPVGKGQPAKAQFSLFQAHPSPVTSLFFDFVAPFKLFAFPIVDFAAFVVSWSASSFLTVNLTQAEAFSEPPYNYTPQTIGFFNFAVVIGQILGLVTAGPLNDYISMRATKRNNGIREPEMRLPAMIPYTLIMILGNFVVAFGYQNGWDWRAIVVVGYTCAGIQVAALPAIASTYAIDSYKPATGSIFVTITVVKNLWGYGLSRFITEWVTSDGFVPPIMTNMCLTTLWCLFGFLFWWKGKNFRYQTRASKVHENTDR